ncbi:MAG: type III-B CRISPR module RAMP protein Cmr6 [Caldimicrobium sp.]|nr:type III-B CRISPR module RAMP protein Cmr6 [Caldimicrobium sp.]MCX7873435.1 type III-B CRISPR module RAMP protein Cmr6 [Caldimicrobium sp.]
MSIRLLEKNKYLPKDTLSIVSSIRTIQHTQYKEYNFYYLFNFPRVEGELPEKIRLNETIEKFKYDNQLLQSIKNRKTMMINSLKNAGYQVSDFTAKCSWRLVIGLGATHPQETSMTLHHIYGVPYIPASAVKGITRHWAVLKFAYNTKEADEKIDNTISRVSSALEKGENLEIEVDGIKFQELIEIFGTQKQAGKVIFMDAYPGEDISFKIDIINVHYPDYYSGSKPPADWQNPRPIKFLTVEKTSFSFVLLSRNSNLLSKAENLLKEALKHHGIGAKTSLGYGLFSF